MINVLHNKIEQDNAFKELMSKHEVKNEKQFIFDGLLYDSLKRFICQKNESEECERPRVSIEQRQH